MKIGITGATGQLGRLVVSKLNEKVKKENITALVRTPSKADDLNVAAIAFDYNTPDNLAEALQDVDTLLLISGNEIGERARQHKNVIAAAQQANVKRIVYTSLLHADKSTLSLAPEHLETEKMILDSGLDYTILRNGWYTENYTASIPSALSAGAFIGSANEGKISSATRADFAEAAATVLAEEGHAGKTYELAGDESYTLRDLAQTVSNETGKNIPYSNLPEDEYAKILAGAGVPEGFAHAIAGWDVSASKNDLFDDSKQLSNLIGRPTTPLAEAVKVVL